MGLFRAQTTAQGHLVLQDQVSFTPQACFLLPGSTYNGASRIPCPPRCVNAAVRPPAHSLCSQAILQQFFPQLYMEDLRRILDQNGKLLYPTFLALHKAVEEGDGHIPPLRKKARFPKNTGAIILEAVLDARIRAAHDLGEREALEEFRAARSVQLREQNEAEVVRRKEQQELDNLETARNEGNVADCGCCFMEYAINRMVHCDGDVLHVSSSSYIGIS